MNFKKEGYINQGFKIWSVNKTMKQKLNYTIYTINYIRRPCLHKLVISNYQLEILFTESIKYFYYIIIFVCQKAVFHPVRVYGHLDYNTPHKLYTIPNTLSHRVVRTFKNIITIFLPI